MKKIFAGLLGLVAIAGLAGCETAVEQPQYAELTFGHLGVIELDVAEVKVVRAYQPTTVAPHVEMEFPISPLETAARWASDRLKPVGSSGTAIVTITDASVLETALEKKDGITGAFTTDQSERYDGTLSIRIEASSADGRIARTASTVTRSTTVDEDISLNERSKIWYGFTEKLINDLNRQATEDIRSYMKAFTF